MATRVKRSLTIKVSPEIGKVSAQYIMPSQAKCIISLAHGAGAGMNHPFMESLANALEERDIATLRFNFPFTEQNKSRPDNPKVAQRTIEAAIAKASEFSATLPVFIGGKSFGGRMSSQFLAAHSESNVKGIIFYGFPLHAAGKPSVDRADHLRSEERRVGKECRCRWCQYH